GPRSNCAKKQYNGFSIILIYERATNAVLRASHLERNKTHEKRRFIHSRSGGPCKRARLGIGRRRLDIRAAPAGVTDAAAPLAARETGDGAPRRAADYSAHGGAERGRLRLE